MTEYEKYEPKEDIRKENQFGCLASFVFMFLILVAVWAIQTFIVSTDLRLRRLEKAAGLVSPANPFSDVPTP